MDGVALRSVTTHRVCSWRRRHHVFSKLLLQPVDFFDAEEVGALTSRLASDCQAVARALSGNFNVAWRNALQCIGA